VTWVIDDRGPDAWWLDERIRCTTEDSSLFTQRIDWDLLQRLVVWLNAQEVPVKARNRDDMVRAFQVAFDEWERRYRAEGPPVFSGELNARGVYFAGLLDELADGQPWADIGPGHPAEP